MKTKTTKTSKSSRIKFSSLVIILTVLRKMRLSIELNSALILARKRVGILCSRLLKLRETLSRNCKLASLNKL